MIRVTFQLNIISNTCTLILRSFIPFIWNKSENSGSTYHWTINFHPLQPLFPFHYMFEYVLFPSLFFLLIDPLKQPIFYLSAQFYSLKQHCCRQNFKMKNQIKLKRELLRIFLLFLCPLTKRYNIVLLVSLLCRF